MDGLLIYLVLDLALATWAAWLADRRGRSFWVYVVFCLIIPIASLLAIPYLLLFTRRVDASAQSDLG